MTVPADRSDLSRKYKLVIFDFDGTLADSFDCFVGAVNIAAKRFRFKPIDVTRLDEFRDYNAREAMVRMGLSWWKLPMVTRAMRRLMLERIDEIRVFDGVDRLLAALQTAGLGIALVTSNSRENVERVLGATNMARIDYLACGASIFGKKAKLKTMLRNSGLAADTVLCVGDESRDAEAAAAVGMDFVGVAWGYTNPEKLQRHSRTKLCTAMDEVLSCALSCALSCTLSSAPASGHCVDEAGSNRC